MVIVYSTICGPKSADCAVATCYCLTRVAKDRNRVEASTKSLMLMNTVISLEQTPFLRVPEIGCTVELRRSPRARRFSLKVSHTERAAILTLPNRGRVEDASAFLARHADWLKRQMERLPEPVPFVDGAVVPLRGEFHQLRFAGPRRQAGVVWIENTGSSTPLGLDDWRSVSCMRSDPALPELCISGEQDHAPRRFSDWLRSEVRKDIQVCVEKHAKTLQCSPKRIAVRDQATRWGSCSTTGTLSFSWRLIFAPPFVLDYVAAHEVAHLREMNHGPRFWRLVREAFPSMNKARAWLNTYGTELHRFGSAA
jgi:predicted metal-dependent hydrolase